MRKRCKGKGALLLILLLGVSLPVFLASCNGGGDGGSSTPATVADFSASPTTGNAPLAVAFTDNSTGAPSSWSWDFGDGGTSALQNPSHTYLTAGTFTVSLAADGPGGLDNVTKVDYITVAPTAQFLATPTTGPEPLTVAFTDQSTGGAASWSWDFGDGGTSALQNPSHVYATGESYTVSLTATGPGGSVTETKTAYINVTPLADFSGAPTEGNATLTVVFTNLSSGSATSFSWDFGDGSPLDTAPNPQHDYTAAGSYTVSLTATGPGGSNTNTKPAYITVGALPPPPVAAFSADNTTGFIPLAVAFTDNSTGVIQTWSWDFGDGSALDNTQNPTHVYVSVGDFDVTLTVTGQGGSDNVTQPNYITAGPSLFQDNFNRADANPLDGNWTTAPGCGDLQIVSDTVQAAFDNVYNCAYWSADPFTNDQYSQVTFPALDDLKGPVVRIQTLSGGRNFYYAKIENPTTMSIKIMLNGADAILDSFTGLVLTPGDTIGLSATGDSLELFVNDVSVGTVTDSTFSSGAPGIWIFRVDNPLDDWEGGSF